MMKRIGLFFAVLSFVSINMFGDIVIKDWGDESKMDTLSYASGVNVAYGMNSQLSYLPLDFKILEEAVCNIALDVMTLEEDSLTISEEQAMSVLNDYMGHKYHSRLKACKDALDSVKVADENAYIRSKMFESDYERALVSKAFGMSLGRGIYKSPMPVKLYWVLQGMRDMRAGKAIMTNEKAVSHINHFMTVTRHEVTKNKASEWLSQVAHTKGVKALPSGLLYQIVAKGDAAMMPTSDNDRVTVHYKGTKQNGDVFDDSYKRGKPASFQLSQVIKGWTEGMKLIGKGGKVTLWIPYNLAYGTRGAGDAIAPYEALRFDIELIDVQHQSVIK